MIAYSDMMTVGQVSAALGVSPTTIRRYISNGKMEACRIGGRWRVPETAVELFLSSCNVNKEMNVVNI